MSCCEKTVSPGQTGQISGCLLCGKPLRYCTRSEKRKCSVCGREAMSEVVCEAGHFVCDDCHSTGLDTFFVPFLLKSSEQCPQTLLEQVMRLPQVHMHGPEHHAIVPCVLLTAYRSNGGELELDKALREALRRGSQVAGGNCGYWGVCGAAAGAGIYMSILLGSNPLHKEAWPFPIELVSQCLRVLAEVGGPRCCKRTCRLSIEKAAELTAEWLGVEMPISKPKCRHCAQNRECIGADCPYF